MGLVERISVKIRPTASISKAPAILRFEKNIQTTISIYNYAKRMSRATQGAERRILSLLHGRKTRTKLTQIHAHFIRHNLHQSNTVLAHFVSICGSLRKMPYARLVFNKTQNPNVLVFNSMIKGYSLSGPSKEPIHLFSMMKGRGIWPDQFTFAPLLKCCSNLVDVKLGQQVHAEVIAAGFEAYNSIGIGLVELYTGCRRMCDAERVFDLMADRTDVIVWNLMVRGFCKEGNVEMGFSLFRRMSERNVVSWNTMIASLAQSGRDREALEVFCEMWGEGFEPDDATLVVVLPVCGRLGSIDVGRWIHSYADSRGLSRAFVTMSNALVDFYCKCGDLVNAERIFREMSKKSVVSWNTMISGLAYNGKGELGLEIFEEMRKQGVDPNAVTFIGALTCCVHAGLVQRGRELFDSMRSKHQINPKLEHYGCLVDLLGRGGCVKEAYELIRRMPIEPNAAIWGALLSACRTHGDLELAECAIKELIDVEPHNSGNYVLLSNIYAELGKWDDVEKARVLMKEKSALKSPGQSVIG